MTDSYDVVGIGNAIVDVIARCDDQFLNAHDMAKGNMRLIETDEAEKLYAELGPAMESSGGSAANTIAGLASFGGRGAFIGRIAGDQLGGIFAHDLRSAGVHFAVAPATDGSPTARSFVLVTPDGERTMNTYLGTSVELSEDQLDAGLIAASKITYLEGYLFDPQAAKAAFHAAVRIAKDAGRQVALSLSDKFCVDRHRAAFRALIQSGVDIVFANSEEICALYEVETFDEACEAVRGECQLAALTRSAQGSRIVTPGAVIDVPAAKVEAVVDTTGAGDLYAAGFLYGHTQGRDLEDCGRLASLAAAEIISHLGARPERALADVAQSAGLAA